MRQRNESMAQSREAQIRSQLTANLNSLSYKSKHNFSPFGIGGGILGIVLAVSGVGFSGILVGLAVGTGVWIAMNQSVKTSNAGIDSEKQRLQDAANNEIRQEFLIKRYLEKKYCVQLTHYSISIIRGRGIDKNALDYILARHNAESVQFVDGWIGKGAILGELVKELRDYPQLSSDLAVVSDPANLTDLCGTHEDFLIPSSCLNATVTGLISRTFLRHDIIGKTDFHGAAFLGELTDSDLTEEYLTAIERDINFIKPGIGETTRVLLRRIPWKVLVNPKHNGADELQHIIQLAHDKGVPVELSSVDLGNYKVCGIIKNLADM